MKKFAEEYNKQETPLDKALYTLFMKDLAASLGETELVDQINKTFELTE